MRPHCSQVNIVGATEVEVSCAGELTGLLEQAANHRRTATTFKNDTSSRSHAVCRIRQAKGGQMFQFILFKHVA